MPPKRPIIHVIDDDTSFRRSIRRLLTAVGHEVDTFSSADQYLATADDLNRRGHRPPVAFVTADDTPGVAERARRAGAVALLTKPVAPCALLRGDRAGAPGGAGRPRGVRRRAPLAQTNS